MTEYLIRLPWPPKKLSPNNRTAHRYATDARNGYKTAAFYAAREVGAVVPENAHLAIQFYPPDRRKRDLDNMLASIKSGLDGIASAAEVDDYGWSLSIARCEPVKGGAVLVHVMQPATQTIEHRGQIS